MVIETTYERVRRVLSAHALAPTAVGDLVERMPTLTSQEELEELRPFLAYLGIELGEGETEAPGEGGASEAEPAEVEVLPVANDPVRSYLREMSRFRLIDKNREIELGREMEAGYVRLGRALSRPLAVVSELRTLAQDPTLSPGAA